MRQRLLISVLFLLVVVTALPIYAAGPTKTEAGSLLRDLPTAFEPNVGQADAAYTFIARRPELSAGFAPGFADFTLRESGTKEAHLRLRFTSATTRAIAGENKLASKTNYLLGKNPTSWHTGIPNYDRIRYANLYPGIDLLFYGNGGKLEHDFVVSPGADPGNIRFRFEDESAIHLHQNGDLTLKVHDGELTFRRPRAYQIGRNGEENVDAGFVVKGSAISFRVRNYDRSRTLIIDPVIIFSTYLAGGTLEFLNGVAVDGTGNVYVTGFTASTDFPTTPSSVQPTCPSCVQVSRQGDAFISKLDPTGHTLVYSTFLGGSGQDTGKSIVVDATGNALIAGTTGSVDFPAVNPVNPAPACCFPSMLFISSLSADGSALNYSGIVGDLSLVTNGIAIAADSSGNAYIATETDSPSFPTTPGTFSGIPASNSAHTLVVLKVSPAGAMVYSTAIPGTAPPSVDWTVNNFVPSGIAVDASGNAFVAGTAGAGLPTTPGVLASTLPADAQSLRTAYALKLDPTAANLLYATYIPETDVGNALAIDAAGGAYVGGDTISTNLAVPPNALVSTTNCDIGVFCRRAYIVKLNSTASQISAGTYLASTSTAAQISSVAALALDAGGNVFVTGTTSLADFPLKNPLQSILQHSTSFNGSTFVSQLSGDLSTLLFSSFLGGTTGDFPSGVAAGPAGQLIVVGTTSDSDFPTTPGALQTAAPPPIGGLPQHGFIASIDLATAAASVCVDKPSLNFGGVLVNTSASQNLTVTNCGNADLHISSIVISSTKFTAAGCTTAVTPGNSCAITVTFSPIDTTTSSGTLTISDDAGLSPQIIGVSGVGGVPELILPIEIFLGDLQVGTTATTGTLVMFNKGNGALNIAGITVSGDYSIHTNNCGAQLFPERFCFLTLNFSPTAAGARPGAVTITDNAQGSPHVVPLSGNGLDQLPLPFITNAPAIPINGTGRLFVQGRNFFPNSVIEWNGSARPTQFVSEFFISAQLTPADLQIGEGTVTVINGPPGGGPSNQVVVPVFAQLPVAARDIAYDPQRNLIYASVGATAAANANSIAVIDPVSQSVVNSFVVGNNPNKLAISDDGQFLYVGLDANSTVAQLSLPSGTVNGTVALGSNFFGGFTAGVIRVLPGLPHSYVVSVIQPNITPSFDHLLVFDDFTARSNQITTFIEADTITFAGTDATKLYAGTINLFPDSFYRLNLDANGLSFVDQTQSIAGGSLDSDGRFIYASTGRVIDPTTKTDKAVFQLGEFSTTLKVDAAASRSYFGELPFGLFGTRPSSQIEAFDNATGGLIGRIPFERSIFLTLPTTMLRWGPDGLAMQMVTPTLQGQPETEVVLMRTSLTSRAPQPGFQISGTGVNGYIPPATISAGGSATFDLTLTPDGGFAGQITLSCSALPGAANCTANPATLTVPASGALTTTVTIATTKQVASAAPPAPMRWGAGMAFAAVLLIPLGLVSIRGDRRRRCASVLSLVLSIGVVVIATAMVGCGGGAGSTPAPPPPPSFTAAGTYNVVLTGTSGAVSRQVSLTVIVQ